VESRSRNAQRAYNADQANLDRQYGDAQNAAKNSAEFNANKQRYEQESALIAQRNAGAISGGSAARSRNIPPPSPDAQSPRGDLRALRSRPRVSNPEPAVYKTAALPIELGRRDEINAT
jgi:hypothetical protein